MLSVHTTLEEFCYFGLVSDENTKTQSIVRAVVSIRPLLFFFSFFVLLANYLGRELNFGHCFNHHFFMDFASVIIVGFTLGTKSVLA